MDYTSWATAEYQEPQAGPSSVMYREHQYYPLDYSTTAPVTSTQTIQTQANLEQTYYTSNSTASSHVNSGHYSNTTQYYEDFM